MAVSRSADVCVIGGGVIGRATALALVARGVRVDLVSRDLPGAASRAAAGLLAPSIEGGSGPSHAFAVAARDAYPAFLESLRERASTHVEHSRSGILDVALDDESEVRLREVAARSGIPYLLPNEVRSLEPALAATRGGVLVELDGYVDNVALMDALEHATRTAGPKLREVEGLVSRIELGRDSATLISSLGDRRSASAVVVAAGAWSNTLAGLPRPLPVRPLKGEMLRYDPGASWRALNRPVYGAGVYAVPRAVDRILVGATSDEAGFDVAITPEAASRLSGGAKALLPQLREREPDDHWCGLRPMSSDSLPVLGQDPEFPALLYATGHSRNGILKAPITGDCIAALFVGEEPPFDLSPFSLQRHEATLAPPQIR